MQLKGNTILITGGGTGIGRGLAEFFHAEGNRVIIAGRRKQKLDETTAANPGMKSVTLDVGDPASIESVSTQLLTDYPALNAVILNAGIMPTEVLKEGKIADAEATFATNLLGPIRLGTLLLPHLIAQPRAMIMTVTSGLAFVPLALNPAYCASKAAIHSWTQSLRFQLKDTAIQVLELIPPYVQTYLAGERQANDPMAMPLKDYLAEITGILRNSPDATEIIVERVKPLRFAAASGDYDAFYEKFNETMAAARANR
jgi:uncharacterized oxidoreductase